MTNLSDLFPTNTSPIKSVQRGDVVTAAISTGSSPESKYVDIAISPVTVAKAFIIVVGSWGGNATVAGAINNGFTTTVMARLTSSTNLRIYSNNADGNASALSCSWQIVEYN